MIDYEGIIRTAQSRGYKTFYEEHTKKRRAMKKLKL